MAKNDVDPRFFLIRIMSKNVGNFIKILWGSMSPQTPMRVKCTLVFACLWHD